MAKTTKGFRLFQDDFGISMQNNAR